MLQLLLWLHKQEGVQRVTGRIPTAVRCIGPFIVPRVMVGKSVQTTGCAKAVLQSAQCGSVEALVQQSCIKGCVQPMARKAAAAQLLHCSGFMAPVYPTMQTPTSHCGASLRQCSTWPQDSCPGGLPDDP
jgi:hypothetical protein